MNNGQGKVAALIDEEVEHVGFDLFNVEDEDFIAFLQHKLSKENKR